MLASFLAAWLIAGRAVQPIRSLSSAARRIATLGLGNRLFVDTRDQEIRVLQGELNETLERLEQTYRTQQRFISNLSHEVKTPIAVLLTEAQILKLGDTTTAQLHEFVQHVEAEMKHLGQLVETLLELMRAEHVRGFPHGELFSLEDVVLKATEHLNPLARARDVRIEIDFPATPIEGEVFGDPRLVGAALENLLRNAITHSPPERKVIVRTSEVPSRVQIDVVDNGPGIPAELMERVFERFFRVPGTQVGTGLGLSIARTIVDLHQGEIRARNNAEGGCTFTIALPVAQASNGSLEDEDGRPDGAQSRGASLSPTRGTHSSEISARS
jgi:signal transduction histidine kinase